MKGNLRGWVEFGIKPNTNCKAAGYDFFVPNLNTPKQKQLALKAFQKSYKRTKDEIDELIDKLSLYTTARFGSEIVDENIENILHLFLALDSRAIRSCDNLDDKVDVFVSHYLIFDDIKKVPGIIPQLNDHICICSGVHVALDPETAGIFYNKSGMGTRGWDVRACVVDEDYSGPCHLSGAYTKDAEGDGKFYCGDKFSQMVVEVIVRGDEFNDMGEEAYKQHMADSARGDDAMGSSDVKH